MTGQETRRGPARRWVTCINTIADRPPPRDVHEAEAALEEITRQLRICQDSRAIFPDVYGIITRAVAAEVREPTGLFWEPSFISRLAGRFAERYLKTLRWSLHHQPQDCGAWGLAYAHAGDPAVSPLQHAALGISAHINFDLALGIYRTLVDLGATRSSRLLRRFKHDHDRVNVLLAQSFAPALWRLAEQYSCRASALVSRFNLRWAARVALGTLARWRERTWDNVLALVNCRGDGARQAVLRRMDQQSSRTGRLLLGPRLRGLLLTPVPLLPFAQALAQA